MIKFLEMKNIDFKNKHCEHLREAELSESRGGFVPTALVVGLVLSAVSNFGEMHQGH
jgi:hypothetical protein